MSENTELFSTRVLGPIFLMVIAALMFIGPHGAAAEEKPLKIVALGDSLTAGYQLSPGEAFPVQLQEALRARGHHIDVINAGVSGDTTSGGLSRLDWSIPPDANAVIVELGANDALRGLPTETTRRNLDEIVAKLKQRGLNILLVGMRAPNSMGESYVEKFDPIFEEVAATHDTLYYPFFLEGIPISPETVLADGMHPTGAGVAIIVENILPMVEELIDRARAS